MKKQNSEPDALKMLRFSDLVRLSIVTNRMTLSRWLQAGRFPRPIQLGENTIAWRLVDIQNWLAERTAATEPPEGI